MLLHLKTNNNIIKIEILNKFLSSDYFIGNIINEDNEFKYFELNIHNFISIFENNPNLNLMKLKNKRIIYFNPFEINVIIESKIEKNIEIEIKSIKLIKYKVKSQNKLPLFKEIKYH